MGVDTMSNRTNYLNGTEVQADQPLRKNCKATRVRRMCNIIDDLQGIGCRVIKDLAHDGYGWRIVIDGGSDIPLPDSMNPNPTTYDVISPDTNNPPTGQGSETAQTNDWTSGGTDGLHFWVQTGTKYDPSGNHILYAMFRKVIVSANGDTVYSVGQEVRVVVATPVGHSTL